jgi:hypothetical protein
MHFASDSQAALLRAAQNSQADALGALLGAYRKLSQATRSYSN